MGSSFLQYILAMAVSGFGVMVSIHFFNPKDTLDNKDRGPVLAYLDFSNRDLEKRPKKRLIWNPLSKGEALYGGDTVRSDSKSYGKIRFVGTDLTINLESDSLIELKQSEGRPTLNLINGGLLVDNKPGGKKSTSKKDVSAPVIMMGKSKLELSEKPTELNLSVDKGGELNIQVTEGDAALKGVGKTIALKMGTSTALSGKSLAIKETINVSAPRNGKTISFKQGQRKAVSIRFTPLKKTKSIYLQYGDSKTNLNKKFGPFSASSGKINANFPLGDVYWRLAAIDKGKVTIKSQTQRNKLAMLNCPSLISPTGEKFTTGSGKVNFEWSIPSYFTSARLSVRNVKTKKLIGQWNVSGETVFSTDIPNKGSYSWTISSNIENDPTSQCVVSKNFTIKRPEPLKAPKINLAKKVVPLINGKALVALEWAEIKSATKYEVNVTGESTKEAFDSMYSLQRDKPGVYQVKVRSVGESGKSKWSKSVKFKIVNVKTKKIVWKNATPPIVTFDSLPNSLKLSAPPMSKVKKWNYHLGKNSKLEEKPPWKSSNTRNISVRIQEEGKHFLTAQGLSDAGAVVYQTNTHSFQVVKIELLNAPIIANIKENRLTASRSGDLKIKWKRVKGATKYKLLLKDRKGRTIKDWSTKSNSASASSLKPGKYILTISTTNESNNTGKEKKIEVVVPKTSNINAPKTIRFN